MTSEKKSSIVFAEVLPDALPVLFAKALADALLILQDDKSPQQQVFFLRKVRNWYEMILCLFPMSCHV